MVDSSSASPARRLVEPTYRPREPERSLLRELVAAEAPGLRAALAQRSHYGRALPRHVDKELDAFLDCGLLHRGFARVYCRRCRAEHLVAFSCRNRALCPSCTARRMDDCAAALVDRLLPYARYRQWVVTFPRRVRYHLAADPSLASAALREVLRAVFAWQRRVARTLGHKPARAHANAAVTFVQRFNSALELSLHFHILIPDAVFLPNLLTPDDPDARPRIVELDPPSDPDVAALLDEIILRVTAMLKKRGRLDDDSDDDPEPQLLLALRPAAAPLGPTAPEPPPPLCARKLGYSLHAATSVHKSDRAGLQRLARYGLRPPLAQGRLSRAPDGTVLYEMKRRFSDGRHVLRFEPQDFVLRICALVPPPRVHMTRYAGIFAPHARGRFAFTGRGLRNAPQAVATPAPDGSAARPPSASDATSPAGSDATPPSASDATPAATGIPAVSASPSPSGTTPSGTSATDPPPSLATAPLAATTARQAGDPDDPTRARRLDWATLLKRSFGIDALSCPKCGERMALIATVEDPEIAARILTHLGLPIRAPPTPPPWRPRVPSARATDDHIDPPSLFQ